MSKVLRVVVQSVETDDVTDMHGIAVSVGDDGVSDADGAESSVLFHYHAGSFIIAFCNTLYFSGINKFYRDDTQAIGYMQMPQVGDELICVVEAVDASSGKDAIAMITSASGMDVSAVAVAWGFAEQYDFRQKTLEQSPFPQFRLMQTRARKLSGELIHDQHEEGLSTQILYEGSDVLEICRRYPFEQVEHSGGIIINDALQSFCRDDGLIVMHVFEKFENGAWQSMLDPRCLASTQKMLNEYANARVIG